MANMGQDICPECGDAIGSRYHEVAHQADVDTASTEELEAAAAILARAAKPMRYGLYDRNSSRHKWRLASVCHDEDLASEQGRLLLESAHGKGYSEYQVGIRTFSDGQVIHESCRPERQI